MSWQLWSALKPFILVVAAIPLGLFVRTVGQWFIDWAKAPTEKAKQRKQKKAVLTSLYHSVANARQYCGQMSDYLSGVPYEVETIDDKLKTAAVQAGRLPVIPTFNLDFVVLDRHAADIFTLLDEAQASQIMTTRLELAHTSRRIDTIVDLLLRDGDIKDLSPIQSQYIEGTRHLLETTMGHCQVTMEMLDEERARISDTSPRNCRPFVIFLVTIALVAVVLFAASLPGEEDSTGKRRSAGHGGGQSQKMGAAPGVLHGSEGGGTNEE